MGRLTFWETLPGGLKGGVGGDDRGSRKDSQMPPRKPLYVDGDTSNEEQPDEVDAKGAETLATSDACNEDKPENCSSDERGMTGEKCCSEQSLLLSYDISLDVFGVWSSMLLCSHIDHMYIVFLHELILNAG